MQSNPPQFPLPPDQTLRNQISMSQPILTRSLPSIVGSVPTSENNVIVSGIYQSYVPPTANTIGTQSRAPIALVGGTGDINISQRQGTSPHCSQNQLVSQKFNPSVISTARPLSVHQQPSYSTVIPSTKYQRQHQNATTHMLNIANISLSTYPPINDDARISLRRGSAVGVSTRYYDNVKRGRSFSQITDKSKKKSKSRFKSKYLLKVINIQENSNPGESILTFEMMLPMHQMRFTCCLGNEINSLVVSNSVGVSGQMPGELGKKDILESLVNTVKKICQHLTSDINSISLNEDYVFHPCTSNSNLVKLSDYGFSVPASLDHDISQLTNQSLQPMNNFNSSCASSRSMSRHPSNEDISWPIGNISLTMTEQQCDNLIQFNENETLKPAQTILDCQRKLVRPVCDSESSAHTIVSTKCTCPINDSTLKVPEYIFSYVKHIVDKLLNLSCKGLIVLPQSNDILTRNFRILEIPTDHMFVGLPCADSSFNVIKGQKDKDFIIAKDNRDPGNVSEKCVYQKPSDGAVLLDSSGEIQYILKPSLIIPSKPGYGNEKTKIKELPSELTHHKDQSLDCDQIVSVLQSLTQIQSTPDQSKDELFDSPVLLEPVKNFLPKSQSNPNDTPETYQRRGSEEGIATQTQQQSQIQVERIFCQYVALPKATDLRHDEPLDIDRDLPRQQVRSRKISNESLDSISAIRTRATSVVNYVNETDLIQKVAACNNQISLQNASKALAMSALTNRMPSVSGPVPGSFVLTNQNQPANIFIQNHPHYSNISQGASVGSTVVMCQNNTNIPVVLTNQNSHGLSFPHMHQTQVVLPPGITQSQISQLHQMQQNSGGQRITVPSSMSSASLSSSQLMSSIQPTQLYPTQIQPFSEQHPAEIIDQSTLYGRQMPLTNVRQSQYCDSTNVLNSIIADNVRIQLKNQQTSAQVQSQATPALLIPHPVPPHPPSSQTSQPPQFGSKLNTPELSSIVVDCQHHSNHMPELDSKPKAEQTIGRFVIRPVTDNSTENS